MDWASVEACADWFQSSPTPEGGRYPMPALTPTPVSPFQSSPTPEGGRYYIRPHDEAQRSAFQSSPTPEGGRYTDQQIALRRLVFVSILAHPGRWALRMLTGCCPNCHRFQSSPTPEGGRYHVISGSAPVGRWFQSSPTPEGGRYERGGAGRGSLRCFNPRPPRKVGATGQRREVHWVVAVSILAHPGRWALRSCC